MRVYVHINARLLQQKTGFPLYVHRHTHLCIVSTKPRKQRKTRFLASSSWQSPLPGRRKREGEQYAILSSIQEKCKSWQNTQTTVPGPCTIRTRKYICKYIHAPLWRHSIAPTTLRRLKLDARDKERNSKHTREMPLYVCLKPVVKKKDLVGMSVPETLLHGRQSQQVPSRPPTQAFKENGMILLGVSLHLDFPQVLP